MKLSNWCHWSFLDPLAHVIGFLSLIMFWDFWYICWFLVSSGIVHENPRILSDGESEEISGTSSEDFVSPVKLRSRPRRTNDVRIVSPSPLSLPPKLSTAVRSLWSSSRCNKDCWSSLTVNILYYSDNVYW